MKISTATIRPIATIILGGELVNPRIRKVRMSALTTSIRLCIRGPRWYNRQKLTKIIEGIKIRKE